MSVWSFSLSLTFYLSIQSPAPKPKWVSCHYFCVTSLVLRLRRRAAVITSIINVFICAYGRYVCILPPPLQQIQTKPTVCMYFDILNHIRLWIWCTVAFAITHKERERHSLTLSMSTNHITRLLIFFFLWTDPFSMMRSSFIYSAFIPDSCVLTFIWCIYFSILD